MNSIRRPRARPRVSSFNFRVFFWLLQREVAVRVLGYDDRRPSVTPIVVQLCELDSYRVRAKVRDALARDPGLRFTGDLAPSILPEGWLTTL